MNISKPRIREFIANYLGANDEEIAREFAENYEENDGREAEAALLEELTVIKSELRAEEAAA
jgi:hypothetical protein